MSFDTALGKKPQCFTGVGAFLDSENLYFQGEISLVIGIYAPRLAGAVGEMSDDA
jgi:hypothetical protein